MRFDIELDLVSNCTCQDLKYLSSLFYDNDDKTILPAIYDKKTLFNKSSLNRGNINTSKYLNFKEVPVSLFQSYIKDANINLYNILNNNSILYPIFSGGEFYSANKKFNFSSLYITEKIDFNYKYSKKINSNINTSTISIFTLGLSYPGIIDKVKEFEYVEYKDSIENTFKNTSKDLLYTIINNEVILNIEEIKYTNLFIGKGDGSTRIFVLPEFAINTLELNGYSSNDFKVTNGLIIFNSDKVPEKNEDIKISCTISPIITYKKMSNERDDIVSISNNISPSSIGFQNGIVCLYNSYNNTDIPSTITLFAEAINKLTNTYRIKARLLSSAGIPIKNKEITFNILDKGAKFVENNNSEFSSVTNMSGEVSAVLFENTANNGIYIQKEWIDGNVIYIPEELELEDTSTAFLYIITADDPILGKVKAYSGEKFIEEYYKDSSINSYYVSGRKIAFIELLNKDGKLVQKYIKPFLSEIEENKAIKFRNLYLKDKEETILAYEDPYTFVSSLTFEDGTYQNGSIPFNKIDLYSKVISKVTKLTFTKAIPNSSNIVGYMLILNKKIDVVATYTDSFVDINSNKVTVEIKNIKSESPFILSGINLEDKNTTLDDLGYYTISDYIQNDYELYPCTYGCVYSDVIDKKCIHNDESYHDFYNIDSNNLLCIHTPEYDATIDTALRCNGVKAQMINPFNLLAKGVQ